MSDSITFDLSTIYANQALAAKKEYDGKLAHYNKLMFDGKTEQATALYMDLYQLGLEVGRLQHIAKQELANKLVVTKQELSILD